MKKCDISWTTVLKAKKTAVLVLMPGLVDRSWSRTVPTLTVMSQMSQIAYCDSFVP